MELAIAGAVVAGFVGTLVMPMMPVMHTRMSAGDGGASLRMQGGEVAWLPRPAASLLRERQLSTTTWPRPGVAAPA